MKIGILTQPPHINYGGVIQNWALQQVLKRMGHEPILINRAYGTPYSTFCSIQIRASISAFIHRYFLGNTRHFIRNPFKKGFTFFYPLCCDKKFVNQKIKKTKQLFSDKDLLQYVNKEDLDAYIVGSDQVWREEYSPSILNYFLSFLSGDSTSLRIAYAASFGKSAKYISKDKMPRCRELLHRFDAVSVREYEGLEILKRDFDYHKGVKVLDPTLLLSADDYRRQISDKDFLGKTRPHVAAYILDESEDKSAILAEVASQLELPVKTFSGEFRGEKMLSVSQWLAEFEGANFVVTDSFHGCVFSIIFHKPFVAIANKDRGIDRFVSLLRDAGLEDRLVYSSDDFNTRKESLLIAPDYMAVEQRMTMLRKASLDFLSNALSKNANNGVSIAGTKA